MKKVIITLLGLFCASALANSSTESPFEGAWQLVQGEYVDEQGQLKNYQDLKLSSVKVISGQHFSFITKADGKFWAAGAGTFEFDPLQYTETPTMTSFQTTASGEYKFNYKFEGNQWLNSRYKDGKRVEFEVWKKLERSAN